MSAFFNAAIIMFGLSYDYFGFHYTWWEAMTIGILVAITDPVEAIHKLKHKGAD